MLNRTHIDSGLLVALFTRAWIEIYSSVILNRMNDVALFTRAWIEIYLTYLSNVLTYRRPLHEGVD